MEYPTPLTPKFPYFTSNDSNQTRSIQGGYPRVQWEPHDGRYYNSSSPNRDPRLGQHSPPFGAQQVPYEPPYQPTNYQLPRSSNIPIDPTLRNIPASTSQMAPMAPMVPAFSSPMPRQRAPINVNGVRFEFRHQKFIIYAMSFLGYSARDVAPAFGLDDSGTGNTKVSAAQVDAAHEYLKKRRIYNAEGGLWERNDKRYKVQIIVKISMALGKLYRLRVKQMEDE